MQHSKDILLNYVIFLSFCSFGSRKKEAPPYFQGFGRSISDRRILFISEFVQFTDKLNIILSDLEI